MEKNCLINKLVYERISPRVNCFNVLVMVKRVWSITPDGKVELERYNGLKSRKPKYSDKYQFDPVKYDALCKNIEDCINNADQLYTIVDDCSGELTIYYPYERKQIVNRGLGSEKSSIERIMLKFLAETDMPFYF